MALIIGLFAFFAFFIIMTMASFDAVVGIEYRNHREQWERDGKPLGFFNMLPVQSTFIDKCFNRGEYLSWTFKMPEWMKNEPVAKKWLLAHRAFLVLGVVDWVVLVFFGLIKL
jgi:hypothetical protein